MEAERQLIIHLLELLKVLGVDQRTIAQRLGVTKGLVSQWKSGFRPLARHQLDALNLLLREAFEEDRRREDRAEPDLKTPLQLERWRLHQLERTEAFKAYEESIQRWVEALKPGAGLRNLHAEADKFSSGLTPILSRRAESWTTAERVKLGILLRSLLDTLRLINRMSPIDPAFWEALADALPREESEGRTEHHGKDT
jgi:transcriptional regulator with XRE-family HTH domain